MTETQNPEEKGAIGAAIGRSRARRFAHAVFDAHARDADGDGISQDGTDAAHAVTPRVRVGPEALRRRLDAMRTDRRRKASEREHATLGDLFERLKDPDGGFSFSMAKHHHEETGWAISRDGLGVARPASDFFDEDGNPTRQGEVLIVAFVLAHADKFFGRQKENHRVVLGAWHNPEDGKVYLDVTDVFSKKSMTEAQAEALGKKEAQKSIADLDEILAAVADGNWDEHRTTIDTGGDPSFLDDASFQPFVDLALNLAKSLDQQSSVG